MSYIVKPSLSFIIDLTVLQGKKSSFKKVIPFLLLGYHMILSSVKPCKE